MRRSSFTPPPSPVAFKRAPGLGTKAGIQAEINQSDVVFAAGKRHRRSTLNEAKPPCSALHFFLFFCRFCCCFLGKCAFELIYF